MYVRLRSAEVPNGYPTKKGIPVIEKKQARAGTIRALSFFLLSLSSLRHKEAFAEEREVYVKIDVTMATEV